MIQSLTKIFQGIVRPEEYFSTNEDKADFLTSLALIMVVGTILLVVTGYIGPDEKIQVSNLTGAILSGNPSPLNRLYFPLQWVVAIAVVSLIRFVFITIMGEDNRSFYNVFHISTIGLLPIILYGMLFGILANLYPWSAHVQGSTFFTIRLVFSLLLFLMMIIVEAYVNVRAFKAVLSQNNGRALLTWFSPYFMFVVLSFPIVLIMVSAR